MNFILQLFGKAQEQLELESEEDRIALQLHKV